MDKFFIYDADEQYLWDSTYSTLEGARSVLLAGGPLREDELYYIFELKEELNG